MPARHLLFSPLKKAIMATAAAVMFTGSVSSAWADDTVSVFTYKGDRSESTVEVPVNPERVAVIDYAVLDIIDRLEADDAVKGMPLKGTIPEYIKHFQGHKGMVNTGTVKEVDFEALMALEPEVIFIGGRLAAQHDKLSEIAPVVFLSVDYTRPLLESVERNASTVAAIFSKDGQADEIINGFKERVENIKKQVNGKTAVVGLVNATQFKTLGDTGRCSFIGRDLGFNNLAKDIEATHGNEASFELLLKLNPEYVFILDRDSAIGRPGAKLARDVMNNEITAKTRAAQEDHIYYLNSTVWYLAEGGLTATDLMIRDMEQALNINR
ncbi:ABC transporter substrate-binding protein [Anaerobiospirillum sp. NML02-A-032]|uniref:siderophore ABC transporter substrate-binding protein n=1 Tax=Anaerobiospirillum sp. NML02-A-032 TaxID=2932818 RepID=UPI001FF16BA7|nr:ABC transporter substrate-binding protein [Anaerobiospirillum sp. NML02-A-032]MCK0540938.1 ABC transporter substrate-binding protein [Anaerobiospirillum sp. NML02-A-032]